MSAPGDWQVVEEALRDGAKGNAYLDASQQRSLAALARLREREAQAAELYEQKIERIEELAEREAQLEQENKRLLHESIPNDNSPYAEAERRVARLEEALREIAARDSSTRPPDGTRERITADADMRTIAHRALGET